LVSSLPVGKLGWSLLVFLTTLDSESSGFLSSGGQTSEFSVFVDWLGDPVKSWVISDGSVTRVNHDDFEEFVSGVLSNPVRVEDSKGTELSTGSFLSNRTSVSVELEADNTLTCWLTVNNTLGDWLFSATSSNSDSVNDDTLFSFVAQSSGLVRSGRLLNSVNGWELSVFPGSKTEDETHHIGLLLLPELFEVFVGGILSNPVRVEDSQTTDLSADSFFSN